MIEIKTQYPYVDNKGEKKWNLIKYYAEDENGNRYYIKQVETEIDDYTEAIDVYPSKYTYEATEIPVIDEEAHDVNK